MKFLAVFAALATAANAHTIWQNYTVNGVNQGQLVGLRAPSSNNPVQDVTSTAIACNQGWASPVSSKVVNVPAGATINTAWGHVIGGPQVPNDSANPIAPSHHGPMMYYLAKVDNAATTAVTGLSWFKIAQDGLDSAGVWGIDRMFAAYGWAAVTLPSCLAPGNYLLRAEALALHSAYTQGGAQFYMSCAQLNVQGTGSWTGSNYQSFPGSYSATDPSIMINIYGTGGAPNNGGKAYTPPGGAVQTCPAGSSSSASSSSASSSSSKITASSSTVSKTTSAASSTSTAVAAHYAQCGGRGGYNGPITCASPYKCTASSEYYSQCL